MAKKNPDEFRIEWNAELLRRLLPFNDQDLKIQQAITKASNDGDEQARQRHIAHRKSADHTRDQVVTLWLSDAKLAWVAS